MIRIVISAKRFARWTRGWWWFFRFSFGFGRRMVYFVLVYSCSQLDCCWTKISLFKVGIKTIGIVISAKWAARWTRDRWWFFSVSFTSSARRRVVFDLVYFGSQLIDLILQTSWILFAFWIDENFLYNNIYLDIHFDFFGTSLNNKGKNTIEIIF